MPIPISTPVIDDDGLLARYPFLPQGSAYIRSILDENGITVEDLVDAPWLEDVRVRGMLRLVDSVLQQREMGRLRASISRPTSVG